MLRISVLSASVLCVRKKLWAALSDLLSILLFYVSHRVGEYTTDHVTFAISYTQLRRAQHKLSAADQQTTNEHEHDHDRNGRHQDHTHNQPHGPNDDGAQWPLLAGGEVISSDVRLATCIEYTIIQHTVESRARHPFSTRKFQFKFCRSTKRTSFSRTQQYNQVYA